MLELPLSLRKAAEIVGLPDFLQDVAVGFHWDILDRLEGGVYLVDCQRHIMYWSAGAERITGYNADDVLGVCCAENLLRHVDETGRRLCLDSCPLAKVIETGVSQSAEVFLHHKDGHRVPVRVYGAPIRNSEGEIIGAFETFSDTSSLLAPLEKVRRLETIAYVDDLTGVANRRLLEHEIHNRFAEFRREGWVFGMVLADVDHFKQFNDRHGHETGDKVLKMVAKTLAHSCRSYDLIGRWGGEEFLMVVSRANLPALQRVAERARALVASSSLAVGGQHLQVTISAGAALVQPDDDPSRLIARADKLLYQSKTEGKNRVTLEVSRPTDAHA